MLSPDEKQVGIARLDRKGRLPFPTLIPLEGKPLAMAVGKLSPGAKPTLALLVDQDGRRFLVTRTADGKSRRQKLSESFKSDPVSMAFQDVDQDGRMDLVVLVLPGGLDPAEAADLGLAYAAHHAEFLVATRLDVSRRLGGVLAAAAAAQLPLAEAGIGPGAADGLVPLTPDFLAARLLQTGATRHAP